MGDASQTHGGWKRNTADGRLDFYYEGTRVGHIDATGLTTAALIEATTTVAAGTTVTGGTGVIATTGNVLATAGDLRATVGNVRLGVVSTFGTTQPTSAVVMKAGTEFAGAITTSGGLMSSATVVRKVIADGTVSNVET